MLLYGVTGLDLALTNQISVYKTLTGLLEGGGYNN